MSLTRREAIETLISSISKAGAFNHFSALFVAKVIAAARSSGDDTYLRSLPSPFPQSWAVASEVVLLYLRKCGLDLSIRAAVAETRDPLPLRQSSAGIRNVLRYPSSSQVIRELMHTFAVPPPAPPDENDDQLTDEAQLVTEYRQQVHIVDLRQDLRARFHVAVTVVSAVDIPPLDLMRSVDPFCELQLVGSREIFRTTVQYETQSPVWNETFNMSYPKRAASPTLTIGLFDSDNAGDSMEISQLEIKLPHEIGESDETYQMAPVAVTQGQAILMQPVLRLRLVTTLHIPDSE